MISSGIPCLRHIAFLLALNVTGAGVGPRPRDIPNFQQVNPFLYRGGQPTVEGLKSLAMLGVKTVVDLREPGEGVPAEEKTVAALGMRFVNVPMRNLGSPENWQISQVLGILSDQQAAPVFVHCNRGSDRTGTVIACYRIAHDHWENAKALGEARSHGMYWFQHGMEQYVLRFRPPASNQAIQQLN